MSVFIKLRNQSGVFVDPETGFSLRFDQEKPVPDPMGKRTRDWLSGGGLIRFSKEENRSKPALPGPDEWVNQTRTTDELQANNDILAKQFDGLSVSDLRKLCKDIGLTYSPKQDKAGLIKRILDFESKATQ